MIEDEQPAKWKMGAMLVRCIKEKEAMIFRLEEEVKLLKADLKEYDEYVEQKYGKGNVYKKKE